jgi:raffinose/stachyose/melibiose transport system permease protein
MILELIMVAGAVVFLFPFYVLLTVSLKPASEVAADPLSPPDSLYLTNYEQAWSSASLGLALVSSATITAISIVMLIALGSLASYPLARWQKGLGNGVYILFIAGLVVPLQLAMVPLYQIMRDLNLLGTYTSLIIFYAGHQLPLTIFLYTGFLRALPRSYEEAALIDGASHFQAFWRVVFPLLRPVTGTVIILNALFIWNDFLTPLLYVAGTSQQTIPVAIFSFVGEYSSRWGLVFAGLAIGTLPILIVYFLLQRRIIKGFASGVKG